MDIDFLELKKNSILIFVAWQGWLLGKELKWKRERKKKYDPFL